MKRPRQLRVLLAAGGGVLIAGWLGFLILSGRGAAEPEYEGDSLARWFARFCLGHAAKAPRGEIQTALRAIGAPAVDYLVRLGFAPTNSTIFLELEAEAQREMAGGVANRLFDSVRKSSSKTPAKTLLNPAWVRENNAAGALHALKPDAGVLLPLLNRHLSSSDPVAREGGFRLLGFVGDHAEKTVPLVVRGLEDGDEAVRTAAAGAVAWGNIKSEKLVRPLLTAVERGSETNRMAFVLALGQSGPAATEALPVLLRFLDEKPAVPIQQLLTAEAICRINPTQPEGLAVLLSALEGSQHRGVAWQILGQIKPRPDIPADRLKMALQDPNLLVNSGVRDALLTLSRSKEEKVGALSLALNTRNQVEAASQLLQLDPNNPDAIACLLEKVRSKVVTLQSVDAAYALGEVGANASAAIPALEAARNTAPAQLKRRIEAALQKIRAARPLEKKETE